MLYELLVIWLILNIIFTILLGIKYYKEKKYTTTTKLTCPKCGFKSTLRSFKKGW